MSLMRYLPTTSPLSVDITLVKFWQTVVGRKATTKISNAQLILADEFFNPIMQSGYSCSFSKCFELLYTSLESSGNPERVIKLRSTSVNLSLISVLSDKFSSKWCIPMTKEYELIRELILCS